MHAMIDSIKGKFVRCLLENGDLVTVHNSIIPKGCKAGDILNVSFSLDENATRRQRELMEKAGDNI